MTSPLLPGVTILLADDDEEDRAMTISALRERRVANKIHCVGDGEELSGEYRGLTPEGFLRLGTESGETASSVAATPCSR